MVKIVGYKPLENESGEKFLVLEVQGGIEAVRSQETGRNYFTARKANVPCTFNEETCKSLIGQDIPGKVVKVEVDEYDYNIPGTDEVISLTHRFEYESEEETVVKQQVMKEKELVM